MSPRRLFVTTALPYANGHFHIGHIMEYIQADIWVRFQRMQGHEVHFVCADDAHGAPIMIAAQKAGKTPQQFVADIAAGRKPYLDGFHIGFDNWHSTDGPENHQLAQDIYRALKANGLIETRTIEQFFDPEKAMFLPDRFIKGECPKCGAKDQYGDNCENCGAVYAPTELKNPYSALSGATPVLKTSDHFFFKLSDPRCMAFLDQWTQSGAVQPEVLNKISEWIEPGEDGKPKMGDWDISRDAPYFGIEIPDAPGKYFYVWLDAPIGYLASLKNYFDKGGALAACGETRSYEAFMADPATEQYHFIGKDIITFHTLFWPATLHFSGRKVPNQVFVHGFLTINNGEKMSKSRGTGLDPLKYLNLGMNPEWLRYYLAAKLSGKNEDVDFNPEDFMARVNSDLIGKYINIASRAAGFIAKRFDGQLGEVSADGDALLDQLEMAAPSITELVRRARNRQGAARDHAAGRPRERLRGPEQALGAGQERRHGRPAARRVHHLHRSLPPAHALPQARAARTGERRGGFPEHRTAAVRRRHPPARRGPPHRRLPAPDAARGREAARRAVRAAAGPRRGGWWCPAANRSPTPSRSTISARSTCASL